MHDEYLWDGSGHVDPDVAALERTLAPLRYEAEPIRLPRAEPVAARPRAGWLIPVLAGAAAAAMVLVVASQTGEDSSGVVGEVVLERPSETVTVGVLDTPPALPEVVAPPSVPVPPTPASAPEPPSGPPSPPKAARRPDTSMPRTLSAAEIRKGVANVKAEALACGKEHGVEAGTVVKVRFGVRGKTGQVSEARAVSPWRSTPLGACVATAISKASFPRFRKDTLSAVYPVYFKAPGEGVDPDLPATLSATDIRDGMTAIKPKARACGEAHDAPSNARLRVKLAVEGKTGRVMSVTAMAPWTGTPLGTCVEAVVRKATFPRFRKERLAAMYPFSFPTRVP